MKKYTDKLFCFSPPVMVATMVIEISLALYAVIKYKINTASRLVVTMLILLGVFQLAEFNVCGGMHINAAAWSRLGYAAISILPALALHLIYVIAGKKAGLVVLSAYALALVWSLAFGFTELVFSGHVCAGNYVIFQIKREFSGPYYVYYYTLLFTGVIMALYYVNKSKNQSVRRAMLWQMTGYFSFILPTAIANTVSPNTFAGLPSIMCGFAVFYALILALRILPLIAKSKN